ncbi:MAG: glutathione S-transferase family protein [Hyphomonadaceae bacterium]
MLRLHYFHPGCSMASHIALQESGLEYEARAVDLSNPSQRGALLALNPKGTVPTLELDERVLTENVAILCHIGDLAPGAEIVPGDRFQYAQMLSLLAWCSNTVHIGFRQMFRPVRFSSDPAAHESVRAAGREVAWAALKDFDARLSRRAYMMGERYSVLDGYPMVFYNWAVLVGLPVAELQHLTGFKDRMLGRPAVRTVLEREGCKLIS